MSEPEEIANKDLDRAFSMLAFFGVPKTRARYVSVGIEVLVSRYDKEVFFLKAEIERLKRERDEAYERAKQAIEALELDNPDGLMEEDAHNGTLQQAVDAISALKSAAPTNETGNAGGE